MARMRRGANVDLTREIPDLTGVVIGIRVNVGPESVLNENLVSAAILCDASGRVVSDEYFVFFNQLATPDMSVEKIAEALGEDRDQIEVDLAGVPEPVVRIVIVVYVNEGLSQRRTLGRLRSCHIRVLNLATGIELVSSEDLAAELDDETALALGALYRHQGAWKFKVLGDGYADGVLGIARDYGVTL